MLGDVFLTLFVLLCVETLVSADNWPQLSYRITEETPPGEQIGNVLHDAALDVKYANQSSQLRFSVFTENVFYEDYFNIGTTSGILTTAERIDRDSGGCAGEITCLMTLDIGVLTPNQRFDYVIVSITVSDINDNPPIFPISEQTIQISEGAVPDGVNRVSFPLQTANDPDSGFLSIRSYSLLEDTSVFSLSTITDSNGAVTELRLVLNERLDREIIDFYELHVVAKDGGTPPLSGTLAVFVRVTDENDNNPVFDLPIYTVTIPENLPSDRSLITVFAYDEDVGLNGEILYSWDSQTQSLYGDIFEINNVSGEVYLRGQVDYETQPGYVLTVIASDRGSSGVPAQARITIDVQDVNDFPPVITVNAAFTESGQIDVAENKDIDSYVALVTVVDEDEGQSGAVSCSISPGPFKMETLAGNKYTISTTEVLDREAQPMYSVRISCNDLGTEPLLSHRDITIIVLDENDQIPEFPTEVYYVPMQENQTIGANVTKVTANDADIGDNGRLTYRLTGRDSYLLSVNPNSGVITTAAIVDYEHMHFINVTIVATDNGIPSFSASASIVIAVVDINDEWPVFTEETYDFASFENQTAGTEIGSVRAIDADSYPYNHVIYRLAGSDDVMSTFDIDQELGRILITKPLNREYRSTYSFTVAASNQGFPAIMSTVPVTVHVADINDNAPQILFPPDNNTTVQVPAKAPYDYVFTRINATDADVGINARLTFSFAREPEGRAFNIDPYTGAISVAADLTKQYSSTFLLLIMVRDNGQPSKSAVGELKVRVNQSLAVIAGQIGSGGGSYTGSSDVILNQSQTILISLAMITLLLVTVLIVAIILVRRRQAKQNERMVNGPCIIADMSSSNESSRTKEPANLNDLNQSLQHDADMFDSSIQKNVYDVTNVNNTNSLNLEFNSHPTYMKYDYPSSTLVKMQNNHEDESRPQESTTEKQRYGPAPTAGNSGPPTLPRHRLAGSPAQVLAKPWTLTQKELAVHRLVQRMSDNTNGDDSDGGSGCSADVSNTDSGRGASEDGDRTSPLPRPGTSPSPQPPSEGIYHPLSGPRPGQNTMLDTTGRQGRKRPLRDPRTIVKEHPRLAIKNHPSHFLQSPHHAGAPQHYPPQYHPELVKMKNMRPTTPQKQQELLKRHSPYLFNNTNQSSPNKHPPQTGKHKLYPCYEQPPRPPRTVKFVDQQGHDSPIGRLRNIPPGGRMENPDKTHSVDSSICETVENDSDGGSTTSGSYILETEDHKPTIHRVELAHRTGSNSGSFV